MGVVAGIAMNQAGIKWANDTESTMMEGSFAIKDAIGELNIYKNQLNNQEGLVSNLTSAKSDAENREQVAQGDLKSRFQQLIALINNELRNANSERNSLRNKVVELDRKVSKIEEVMAQKSAEAKVAQGMHEKGKNIIESAAKRTFGG